MKKLYVTIEEGKMMFFSDAKELDSAQYVIPYDIEALTIGQAQEIMKAVAEDEDYIAYLSGTKEGDTWSSALLGYARKAVGLMAKVGGIEQSAVDALTDEEVIAFAPNFEFNVLRPLFQFGRYEPKPFDGFDFEGVRYIMPLSINDGFGGVMPMAEISAEEWAESNDLRIASANPAEYMHLIVAILCRPAGEQYNERVARERAEKFKELPCSVALDVFFCRFARMSTTLRCMVERLDALRTEAVKAQAVETPSSGNGDKSSTLQPATQTAE